MGFNTRLFVDSLIPKRIQRLFAVTLLVLVIIKVAAAAVVFLVLGDMPEELQYIHSSMSNEQLLTRSNALQTRIESITNLLIFLITCSSLLASILIWNLGKFITLSASLTRYISDGVCLTGKNGRVLTASQQFCDISGLKRNSLIGSYLPDLIPETLPLLTAVGTSKRTCELAGVRPDGSPYFFSVAVLHLSGKAGLNSRSLVTINDISNIRQTEIDIEKMAYTDDLTRLANRPHLMNKLNQLIQKSETAEQMFAVLYLDLDGFKDINDSMGHSAGDELLKIMSDRFTHGMRDTDFVARLGGDEFCVILGDIDSLEQVRDFAERLLNKIAEPAVIHGRRIRPRSSIGVAIYPDDGIDRETLLMVADTAMYEAKHAGKHQVAFYNPELTRTIELRISLEQDLRHAIQDNQFELHYQPQVSLTNGRLWGVEALVRWRHPTRGMVFPDAFIDVAERIGFIAELGNWVLREACRQQRAWSDQGINLNVAVNISGSHFQSGELLPSTLAALKEYNVNPENLELEITEGVMQVAEKTVENFHALKNIGVRIAIDDFGTGYSSLNSLRALPVDHIKIDRTFLQNVLQDNKQAVIISTIIGMANALGLKIIAEGVEDLDQLLLLQGLGCTVVQGYYFSKPVTAAEIPALYTNGFSLTKTVNPQPKQYGTGGTQ